MEELHIKVIFVSSHMICYRLGIKGYSTQTVKAQDFWILDSLITYLSQDEKVRILRLKFAVTFFCFFIQGWKQVSEFFISGWPEISF